MFTLVKEIICLLGLQIQDGRGQCYNCAGTVR